MTFPLFKGVDDMEVTRITESKQIKSGVCYFYGIAFPKTTIAGKTVDVYDEVVSGSPTTTKKIVPQQLTSADNYDFFFPGGNPVRCHRGLYVSLETGLNEAYIYWE